MRPARALWTLALLQSAAVPRPEAPASAPASRPTKSELDAHVVSLKKRVDSNAFTFVVEPPFVVIGDQAPERVRQWAEGTVRWAATKLRAEYFDRDPEGILDVWLFGGRESYEKNVERLFHESPGTPFGWYSPEHRALIMNIATGGGTLVHEMVHPFMHANFPECPAWLNEGLGSLYEQCEERNGRIHGRTNWRLPVIQEALREKRAPAFESLLAATDFEFYGEDRGLNYAAARYLCYALQEKGLLRRFYREFRAAHPKDASGLATLRSVLGADDLSGFRREWETLVLGLRFP